MVPPGDSVSRPFGFRHGGVLSVEARPAPPVTPGIVEFRLEGSDDGIRWSELATGTVSTGERVDLSLKDRKAAWGRVRLRTSGGEASVCMRGPGDG